MKRLLSLLETIAPTSLTDVPYDWKYPYIVVVMISERKVNEGSGKMHERVTTYQINLIAEDDDETTLRELVKVLDNNKLDSSFTSDIKDGIADYQFEVEFGS